MARVLIDSISKSFSGSHEVLHDLTLDIADGEFVTLLGPSGCGKTTLLRMIAGLEGVDKGDIYIGDIRATHIPAQNRKIAMVFQSYALFPHMTVRENILFGLKIQKASAAVMAEKFAWSVSLLCLQGLENRLPREISGGQRQRVALARALVLDPQVLLLDEPLSNLDTALREAAMEELKRIHLQVGKTIIYVTHNQIEGMIMSGRIALLNAGSLEQFDTPRVIYDRPATFFSAQFIGSPPMNILSGEISVSGEQINVVTALGDITIDRDRFEGLLSQTGRQVTVGIRPQDVFFLGHHTSRRASDTKIMLTVDLIETMGDRSLVVGKGCNGSIIRFMVTRDEEIVLHREVPVFVDGRRVHLFDPTTGKNVARA